MKWALILVIANGYAGAKVEGFTSEAACKAALNAIWQDYEQKSHGWFGYAVGDQQRFGVSEGHCVKVE